MPSRPNCFPALRSLLILVACILVIAATLLTVTSSAQSIQETSPQLVIQRGPDTRLEAIAYAPDGLSFATASGRMVQVWNTKTCLVEHNLAVNGTVESVAWSPDGSRLAVGGLTNETGYFRGLVMIWDMRSGRVLQDWRTGYATISSLAWSADGQILATAGGGDFEGREKGASARLWSRDGQLLHTLENYIAGRAVLVIAGSGRKIALSFSSDMGGTNGTRVYDIATGKPLTPLRPQAMSAPMFASDGTLLNEKPAAIAMPTLTDEPIAHSALSPDRQWLVTAGYANDRQKPKPAFRLWQLDKQVKRWRQVRQVAFTQASPLSLSATRGMKGDTLAVGIDNGPTSVWNLRAGQLLTAVPGFPYETHIALSPDATYLAASFLWDLRSKEPLRKSRLTVHRAVAFSRDGLRLVDESGLLNVRTGVRTAMEVTDEEGGDSLVGLQSASFSADGELLATVDDTKSSDQLHIWNGKTGKLLRHVRLDSSVRFGCLAFAPQGDVLAVAGGEGGYGAGPSKSFLGLLDGNTGALLRRFDIAAAAPYGIAAMHFSPDGKTLATSGMVFRGYGNPTPEEEQRAIQTNTVKTPERTLRFWDVASGTVRSSLPIALNYPLPVAFINKEMCAVATPTGVQFWNIAESKLLAELTILEVRGVKSKLKVEWLVQTLDGRFDASQGAGPFLRWRVNGALQAATPAGVSQVPGLLGQVLDLERRQTVEGIAGK